MNSSRLIARTKNSNFFIWVCLTILIIVYLSLGFSEKKECSLRNPKEKSYIEKSKIKEPCLEDGAVVKLACGSLDMEDRLIVFERNRLLLERNYHKNRKPPVKKENTEFIIRNRNKKRGIYIISTKDNFGDELFMSVDYSSDNPLKKDIIFKKSSCPEKDNSLKIKIIDRNCKKIFKFFDGSFMCCDEKFVFASSVLKKSICEVSIL